MLLLGVTIVPVGAAASAGSSTLPDNRAWEQVSPVEKRGYDITERGAMAAVDGNRLMFRSNGPFAGAETSLGADGIRYLATRTASGWKTVSITPPNGGFTTGFQGYQGFTADLSTGVIAWKESDATGKLDPAAPTGLNLYLRDTAALGPFQLLNGSLESVGETPGFFWGSTDLSKLAISSGGHLTPDSPCAKPQGGLDENCAYEWDAGALRLASVLPGGEPAKGSVGSAPEGNYDHAISDDGRRLFFVSPPSPPSGPSALYARLDSASTVPISESERTLPGGAGGHPTYYQSAEAAHGDRVLFSTTNSLLDADTDATNDLYLYDFNAPEGERLTLVSEDLDPEAPAGAEVDAGLGTQPSGGLVGTSEDLRRIYFVANNQIVPGESEAPGPKLYLWDDTGASPTVRFLGTLQRGPDHRGELAWIAPAISPSHTASMRTARVTRDGRFLVFPSASRLTGFDNEGREEIYRYDAASNALTCVSCVSDAFPADGEIALDVGLYGTKVRNHQLNNVSESGQVFFQTTRGLVPHDSNGRSDVYEYEDGQLHLISKGTGNSESFFLDATPNGSDVFFTTGDRLVGWDTDGSIDAYDARVDGGLPEPPPPTPPCEGDACQPPPTPPGESSLASESFQGRGNVIAPKPRRSCARSRARRDGKCQKRRATNKGTARGGRG